MLKAYKYRLYPTPDQEGILTQHFGVGRYVYNWALQLKQREYEIYSAWRLKPVGDKPKCLSVFDCNKLLTLLKAEYSWIGDAPSQTLQQEVAHLFGAYTDFHARIKERKQLTNKKGKLIGYPRFKSKKDRQSLSYPQGVKVDFDSQKVHIPKLGTVTFACSRSFIGKVKTTTVSKETTGKYFIALLVDDGIELPPTPEPKEAESIGIDVGLEHFATFSTGEKVKNPRHLKRNLYRLKRLQRSLSRKNNHSRNYAKAKRRRALLEEKIANQRKDFLHKATHNLVCKNQATSICVEYLSVKNMMQNHILARAIADASWGEFFRQLKYKAQWYGKNLLEIGRFEPSSKTCHLCKYRILEMSLSVRTWKCPRCGAEHDRDVNAAKNIVRFAFAKFDGGTHLHCKTPAGQPGRACG